jgi:hypothetical protein
MACLFYYGRISATIILTANIIPVVSFITLLFANSDV